jgi:hypothetical protein
MDDSQYNLEILWDNLLSRQPERILAAYATLNEAERTAVTNHLQRMASQPGWHPEQQCSARAAIGTIIDHWGEDAS